MTVHWRPSFVFLVVLTQEMQCSRGLADADNSKEDLRSVALVALVLHQHRPFMEHFLCAQLRVYLSEVAENRGGGAGMLMVG